MGDAQCPKGFGGDLGDRGRSWADGGGADGEGGQAERAVQEEESGRLDDWALIGAAQLCGGGQLCAHAFEAPGQFRPVQASSGQARPGQGSAGIVHARSNLSARPAPLSAIDSSRAVLAPPRLASPRLGCFASRPFHGPPSLPQGYTRCASRTLSFENRALNPD
ncbi:hypothetical protein L1887_48981 [Cichorium endivia]|nr:hypothetical protein L1887_48981 [Cichorium endivia]